MCAQSCTSAIHFEPTCAYPAHPPVLGSPLWRPPEVGWPARPPAVPPGFAPPSPGSKDKGLAKLTTVKAGRCKPKGRRWAGGVATTFADSGELSALLRHRFYTSSRSSAVPPLSYAPPPLSSSDPRGLQGGSAPARFLRWPDPRFAATPFVCDLSFASPGSAESLTSGDCLHWHLGGQWP